MRMQRRIQPTRSRISPGRIVVETSPTVGGSEPRSAEAPLGLRLKVMLTRARLDREIVSGHPSTSTDAIALRVRQLIAPNTRQRIARELRSVVEYVDRRGARPIITTVVIDPAAVRAGRSAILGLAQRLEGSAPVQPAGIVFAQRLLTDGAGPIFNRNSSRTVTDAIWEVVEVLEGHTN
jgi:hypothetical protein